MVLFVFDSQNHVFSPQVFLNNTVELEVMARTAQHESVPSLDEIPAAPPPPGVIPNFINPKNQESAMNATLIICLSIATVCVWLRVYTKLMISKSHGYDDCEPSLLLSCHS